jgi:DNA polymerase-3 subunit alpha
MAAPSFIHLRLHTQYSLSQGAVRIKELPQLCRTARMPAVAITDSNNLFGAMEFSGTLRQAGIQPIIGCELSLSRDAKSAGGGSVAARERQLPAVIVLVQNATGYQSLLRLIADAYTLPQPQDPPHVTSEALCANADGLILLTGGPHGPIGRLLRDGKAGQAEALLASWADVFGDRLYVEVLRHGLADEAALEAATLDLADALDLPIVATNDVHFTSRDMYEAHDALLCIAQGTTLADRHRRRLSREHGFKSAEEMAATFADLPDAIANSVSIARRCAFAVETVKPILPHIDFGSGRSEEDVLRDTAARGLAARLSCATASAAAHSDAGESDAAERYRTRLTYELDVICEMGFAGYFLVVADFIQWAKSRSIPVGPGRGSGAGSVVAWSLTITDLDPIRFGLLFERFLNPERVSMPDFDIDFCQDRRDEVIAHVQERYGADRVAQIITFGKLQARAVLRDVGRVLGMPYGYVDKLCTLVPNNPAHPVTLAQAIEGEPQLQAMIAADEAVARLVSIGKQLEGLYRHASTHAAGIVIADRPLVEMIPLYRDPRSPLLVTGFNMKWVEQAGLVKFDFLGLKTLTVLAKAVELLQRGRRISLDLAAIPLDDRVTFEMLGRGDTVGVFQLESAGMRDVLRKLKPDTFEDIIAVVALYRPGPMDNIPSYIKRKHGEEAIDYLHPSLEDILRETYGIMIYQEQVMQIAQVLSGYTLGGADILRRAMGKKIQAEMDQQCETFVEGAKRRGVSDARAKQIFELVSKFAGYGFNKSHAAAYALVAYQTAYLKANYPLEFFAASMTLDLGNTDKLNGFRQELDRLRIRLLPPDINASEDTFTVEFIGDGPGAADGIRYGLAAVKTVGTNAIAAIVAERKARGRFRSIEDFAARVDSRYLNKRQLENLARAGAFDSLNTNRRQVVESADLILRRAAATAAEREDGQISLFAEQPGAPPPPLQLPGVEDWLSMDRLREELNAVGFYLSAHPLDSYAGKLARLGVVRSVDVFGRGLSGSVILAGTVIAKRERSSAKGNRYAFVQLSDASGLFEITVFSELLAARRPLLEAGQSLLIRAQAQTEGEGVRCVAEELEPVAEAAAKLGTTVNIHLDSSAALPGMQAALAGQGRGQDAVRLIVWLDGGVEVTVGLPSRYALSADAIAAMGRVAGVREIRIA